MNIRNQYEQARVDVMRITGMKDQAYNTLFFETGIEYLKIECGGDEDWVAMMGKTEIYWQWWKNVWANRDLYYQELVKENKVRGGFTSYTAFGSIHKIDSYPTTMIYQKSYSQLMKKIH